MARIYQRGNRWWLEYTDHRGQRRRKSASTDKGVAQKLLGDALSNVEKMKAGMLQADPAEARKAIDVHRDAYLADLARRGRDEMYRYTIGKRIDAAAKSCKWTNLRDCSTNALRTYLANLAQSLSPKTVNDHLADLSSFFRWCCSTHRLEYNPCEGIEKANVKKDKKRRALSVRECQALLDAAPADRRLVYAFLIYTGVRRGEAAVLVWGDVHADGANPFVELPASITKSGKAESVPLVPALASMLVRARGVADDAVPVFPRIPTMPEFRADLAEAKIDEKDERGRVVVLHSLRHSLATMLAAAGVPMPVAQRIMRHRDIRLTAETYTDEGLLPLASAMRALPVLMDATVEENELAATGTDCAKTVPNQGHCAAQSGKVVRGGKAPGLFQVANQSALGNAGHARVFGRKAGDLGFEPNNASQEMPENKAISHDSDGCCAKTVPMGQSVRGAGDHEATPFDADLARVNAAWPSLPEALRRAVLALVASVKGGR